MIIVSDMIGKPFLYGGRGPNAYDCYGVATEVYRRAGSSLPDITSVTSCATQHLAFNSGANRWFDKVEEPQYLDIILFQIMPKYVTHCGVYLEHGKFIHVMDKINVSIEYIDSILWSQKIRGIYRLKRGHHE